MELLSQGQMTGLCTQTYSPIKPRFNSLGAKIQEILVKQIAYEQNLRQYIPRRPDGGRSGVAASSHEPRSSKLRTGLIWGRGEGYDVIVN